jgi:hypothetical protein
MTNILIDRALTRLHDRHPELAATGGTRSPIVTRLGQLDVHEVETDAPDAARVIAVADHGPEHTHIERFDPDQDDGLELALDLAVEYLKGPTP